MAWKWRKKRRGGGCKVLQHFLPPYLSFSPDKQLWEETKSNEWSFEESLERSRPLWLWWLCMFAPKSIEPQVPLCLTSPAVIDRIPEIPEKAPVRELDCTTARDRRCFLRREPQQNRAEWTSRTFLEQPFKPRPLLVWRQANHRSLPTYYWRCDDISWCSNNNIKGNDNCVLMTYYAACSKLLLNPRLENMDTNVQKTLSTPQKKSPKSYFSLFLFCCS